MNSPNEVQISYVQSVIDWDGEFDENGHQNRSDLAPGSASWAKNQEGDYAVLNFVCPCGCGLTHAVSVVKSSAEKKGREWVWNGDKEKPTLTPSIQCLTPCRWHGYLTDGIFKKC